MLRKAVHPLPERRYEDLSEFIHELRYPSSEFLKKSRQPLIERNPVLFWQSLTILLIVIILILLART